MTNETVQVREDIRDVLMRALRRVEDTSDSFDWIANSAMEEIDYWLARHAAQARSEAGGRVAGTLEQQEFCSSCQCDLCRRQSDENSAKTALADPEARCWSCTCGWIGCYTPEEVAEYGEPPECQNCYREGLVECEANRVRNSLGIKPPPTPQVQP